MNHLVLVSILFSSVAVIGSTGTKNVTAQRCGVDQTQPAQRVFADSDGKQGWHEYRTVADVPELQLGFGEAAMLWQGSNRNFLVRTQEPGEDFAAYTDYCFNQTGRLVRLKFELRTAWGWGYREEGPIANGILAAQTSEFFSTKTEGPIPRPEQADDIPEALRPRIYLRKSQLPFSKLLSQ